MDFCFFCNQNESYNYKPEKNIEFVCSQCVQILLRADQEDLKKAYAKAIKHEYFNKAKAITMFLEEEIIENGKTKKSKRNMERKRPLRKARLASHKIR
jgi:hypothetical protein